jgi:hypothetical protein
MHAIHNARIQLLATALNNLGLAFIVTGFVAPGVTGQLHGGWHALVTLAWIVTGSCYRGQPISSSGGSDSHDMGSGAGLDHYPGDWRPADRRRRRLAVAAHPLTSVRSAQPRQVCSALSRTANAANQKLLRLAGRMRGQT